MKHAMKIGSHYKLNDITVRDWLKVGADAGMDGGEILERVRNLGKILPDAVSTTQAKMKKQKLHHGIIDYMSERIVAHVKSCSLRLAAGR
jgi:hypothetical protein